MLNYNKGRLWKKGNISVRKIKRFGYPYLHFLQRSIQVHSSQKEKIHAWELKKIKTCCKINTESVVVNKPVRGTSRIRIDILEYEKKLKRIFEKKMS